jgi:hypothetical protein
LAVEVSVRLATRGFGVEIEDDPATAWRRPRVPGRCGGGVMLDGAPLQG